MVGKISQSHQGTMDVRQCLSSGRRKSLAKKTMPTHESSTADAKEKTWKTKTCLTLMELAGAFRDIAQQVCFHPKQLTYKSLASCVPASNTKWPSGYKRTANPQKITIIMSDIQRLTLISDPTNKFPKNANNSFKV